jgi:hypothetical protein
LPLAAGGRTEYIQHAAVDALRHLSDRRSIPTLIDIATDVKRPELIRVIAVDALQQFRKKDFKKSGIERLTRMPPAIYAVQIRPSDGDPAGAWTWVRQTTDGFGRVLSYEEGVGELPQALRR